MTESKVQYPDGVKKCGECLRIVPVADFYLNSAGYYSKGCKPCTRAISGKRYHARKDEVNSGQAEVVPKRFRDGYTKVKRAKLYGLTLAELEAMEEAQDHRCAICAKKRRLCIDHCHETDAVRGLLCFSCNSSIGQLGDTSSGVMRAVEYLWKAELDRANRGAEGGVPSSVQV